MIALKNRTNMLKGDRMDLLQFVLTMTYFVFDGINYRQRFDAAMGSSVCPIVSNLFMEHLEQKALIIASIRPLL